MMKRRRPNIIKKEKQHLRSFLSKQCDFRPMRQLADQETTMFAVWKSRDNKDIKSTEQFYEVNLKTNTSPQKATANTWTTKDNIDRRRSTRLNQQNYVAHENNNDKNHVILNKEETLKKDTSKSLYKEISELYKIKQSKLVQKEQNVMTFYDSFMDEVHNAGFVLNQDKLKMNIENKISQFNNILKGKSSPSGSRCLKRKQNENNENERPIRLLTPSKYVYNTPENQKFKPPMPKQGNDLIPAVYQTSKKHKVLYDLDKNIAKNINLETFTRPGMNVPIDNRFLKPICKNSFDDNQFMKMPFENSIDINAEINLVQNNILTEPQSDPFLESHDQDNTLDFTIVNKGTNFDESNLDLTIREIPHSSRHDPHPLTFEQEIGIKCTERPAKIPRVNFHRSLSRKSLKFEVSPVKNTDKHSFGMENDNFNFLQQQPEQNTFNTDLYSEPMDSFQLNISLNDNDY